jgi:hypothetical protein
MVVVVVQKAATVAQVAQEFQVVEAVLVIKAQVL